METTKELESFAVIGLAVRTTNENQQASKDISDLWNKFLSENVITAIPNKISDDIYCVYTNYEGDFMKPYTTVLGCKVKNLDFIPDGLTGKTIEGGNFKLFIAKGQLMEGVVVKEWMKIWNSSISRVYKSDFEVYKSKMISTESAEVEIYVSVK